MYHLCDVLQHIIGEPWNYISVIEILFVYIVRISQSETGLSGLNMVIELIQSTSPGKGYN
jgi:hypothetical protein